MEKCQDKMRISLEEAKHLLFDTADKNETEQSVMCFYTDQYGDYIYPSDLVTRKPNTAYGSSDGFNYLCMLENMSSVK